MYSSTRVKTSIPDQSLTSLTPLNFPFVNTAKGLSHV